MRKRISALLICILLLVSSAGCGGDTPSQPAQQAESSSQPAASAEAPTEQRTTLTMFSFDEGMKDILQDSTIFQKLMEETGVDLKLEVVSGVNTDEKRSIMIASGEYPDILDRIDERFIDAEALVPLDDLIDAHAPNIKKAWGDSLDKLRFTDGSIYFLGSPKNREEVLTDAGSCFLVQYDVLEQLGYPTPKTLDDVFNMLVEYTANNKDINGQPFIPFGIWADSWGYNHTVNNPALWTNGFTDDSDAYVDQKTFDVKYFNTTDYFKTYLNFLNKLYNNGLLNENSFITKKDEFDSMVANGRVLAMFYHTALISESEAALRQAGMPERCYARFPVVMNEGIKDRSQVYCESYDTGMAITKNCKEPEKAIQFIDYLLSVEGNVLLNWGIEGVHYDVADGKRVQKPEIAEKWNSDPNYRWQEGLNCLSWWPQYNGAIILDDGDFASPMDINFAYNNADAKTKAMFDQYGIRSWGENFDTSGERTPYGFAWTIQIESGSPAELARNKADELRHIMVGEIVMSKDEAAFEQKWGEFSDRLYSECNISEWEKAMSEQIKARVELWS